MFRGKGGERNIGAFYHFAGGGGREKECVRKIRVGGERGGSGKVHPEAKEDYFWPEKGEGG